MKNNTHVVKDRYTHKAIFSGSEKECISYMNTFGFCYVEANK